MSSRGNFNKNVQVPIGILLKMKWILHETDRDSLSEKIRPDFDEVLEFIRDKERKIVNRMHYDEYMQAKGDEKEKALETYLTYKNVKRNF